MKVSTLRAVAALLVPVILAACGGKQTYPVTGVVEGLTTSGLVLANGSDTVTVPAGATSFVFPKQVEYGTDYNITVLKSPDHFDCTIGAGSGSAGHTVSIAATVQCYRLTHELTGQVTGLPSGVAVNLSNGSDSGLITATGPTDGSQLVEVDFGAIGEGLPYGVVVQGNPTGYYCTVTNGTGVMGSSAISNVLITCKPISA
ncbi:hypothetical protein ACLB1G_23875 [Oxalobacteraceae bacterium A2-2]